MSKVLFAINALAAWCALALSFTLNLTGYYVDSIDPSKPTILGNTAAGISTPLERFFDWITYFTIWSNAAVAIVLTVLVFKPALFNRQDRTGGMWRALRLDSVMMIVFTGIIFNLLLSTSKTGIDAVSNAMLHIIVPILTFVVWLLCGPRGLIYGKTVAASLVVPLAWVVFALVRGGIVGAYPYPFLDVATKGLLPVLQFVLVIVVAAVIFAFILMGLDSLIRRLPFVAPAPRDR